MKILFAVSLNAYLLAILSGVLYLSHQLHFDKIEVPVFIEKDYPQLPNFAAFKLTQEKKKAFFDYFGEIIDDENNRILMQRDFILANQKKLGDGKMLTKEHSKIISKMVTNYGLEQDLDIEEKIISLLKRVDIIPRSLALAQAAKESAWGTSRFARHGNSFFGQWCYNRGCGMVPLKRRQGAYHEVKSFSTPARSVRGYLLNINTHFAYEDLRALRADTRNAGDALSGLTLAQGLTRYSERGNPYVKEIRSFIKANKLSDKGNNASVHLRTR